MYKQLYQGIICCIALGVSACMTTFQTTDPKTIEFKSADKQFSLEGIYLGQEKTNAVAKINVIFGDSSSCEDRKVQLGKVRKAFAHRTCEYEPDGVMLNGEQVTKSVAVLVDNKLARLDIETEGGPESFASARASVESVFSKSEQRSAEGDVKTESVWVSEDQELIMSHDQNTSVVKYRLLNTRLASKLPSLAK